jgi:sialidase-1
METDIMCKQRIWTVLGSLLLIAAPVLAADQDGNSTLTAEVRQRVHPVLISNDHNPLFHLVVSADASFVTVESIAVSLAGTDDVADVDSLQLFFTSDGEQFSPKASFGEAIHLEATAGNAIVFRGHARLQSGENHFWLSCRMSSAADLDHKLDATCIRIETSAGPIGPTDQTGGVRKRIGIALRKHWDDGVHTYRIPALATTPRGTLLCVYDMRRRKSRDLQEDIDIGLLRSTDHGNTWEAQRVIMDMGTYDNQPQELNGVSDPGIIVDRQTGEIFCFAVWMVGRPGTHQWSQGGSEPGFEIGRSAQMLMVRSRDDGLTWSKPQNMTRTWKRPEWILYAPSPQQGITLADGTLVMPTQGRDADDRHFSNLLISRDHGENWSVGPPASLGNTECQAVELGDGSIMLNMRSEQPTKFRTVAISRDGGQTWQPHATNRKTLIEPNCNGSLYRFDYQEGDRRKYVLLFANPHSQTGRDHHTIQVSLDDGRTWPEKYHLLLDAGRGRGYPSLSRAGDGHVGIVYEGSQADLVFECVDWSLTGRTPLLSNLGQIGRMASSPGFSMASSGCCSLPNSRSF